ncbi:MAG: methyltransferase domain-containing protein [Desulfobacterales bacterium]|nr:MAG: methyltransferase domain-containing protein [Desulfobacterales bacterium]
MAQAHDHYCVICDNRVPGFEHGGKSNDRKFCPNCRSKGRYRLIWLYLLRELSIDIKQIRVLHLAPEHSLMKKLKSLDNLVYITADLMVTDVDVRMDLTRAGLVDRAFDLILCNHVLEHIEDDAAAIKELYRVLSMAGELLLTVPTNKGLVTEEYHLAQDRPLSSFTPEEHYREYGFDLVDKLRDVGFAVEVVWYMKRFSLQEVRRLGLKNEVFFVCRKR